MNRSEPGTDDERLMRRARKRVAMKTGFLVHLLVFVLVNLGLFALNATLPGPRWHLFPLVGWGFGLAIHGIVVLVSLKGEGLHDRMVAGELERLRARR
jgi:uncharacterized integral membrane protein